MPERLSEAIEAAIYNALTGEFAGNTGGSLGGWTMELHEYERQEVARVLLWELKPIIAAELAAKDAEIARLREALKPFAHAGKHCDLPTESSSPTFVCDEDYRRAAKALGEGR